MIDPEEGAVRIVFFVAMAAFLVVALCVPEAFGDHGLTIAIAYAVVRICHIVLFTLASADDAGAAPSGDRPRGEHRDRRQPARRRLLPRRLGAGRALGARAAASTSAGPYFFGAEGWKIVPEHFAERHGLILIIALGESIVAIGAGVETAITPA